MKSISIASGGDDPDREGGCPGFDYYIIYRNEVRTDMDDYRKNNNESSDSGYEPNFILKEAVENDTGAEAFSSGAEQDSGAAYGGTGAPHDAYGNTEPRPYTGSYGSESPSCDTGSGHPGHTDIYSGMSPESTADPYDRQDDPNSFRDPRVNFRKGDSCSWNNADGLGKVKRTRKERTKKPSPPVTLTRRTLAMLIALCVVVSGFFGVGGAVLGSSLLGNSGSSGSDSSSGSVKTTGYDLEDATGSNMTVQEITEKTKASVVEIKTESVSSDSWMQQYVTEGAGSGVIISKDGYIVTNNHVIDGASKITVTTADDKSYEARLVGTDSNSDVAVIKIKASDLTPATYGNSDQLKVGDMAVAIGNPLGELGGTVTAGIISALDRELSIDGKTMTLLQTDSSINPGNSGGGLFNGDGQLIGIVVAKSSGSDVEGLGFAIPINKAADVAQQLMDNGYVKGQPYTGMSYTEGSQQSDFDSFFSNGSSSSSKNVYIASVDSSKAKRAGFQAGDMVFAVDGKQITSFEDLSSIITSHKVGDKVTYTIVRNGKTQDIKLTLQEKKASDN